MSSYSTQKKSLKANFISLCTTVGFLVLLFFISSMSNGLLPESFIVAPIPVAQADVQKPRVIQKISEARLRIPKIGVDAVIKNMGITSEGAMAVPGNRVDVGWFSLGTIPGDTGSAVIGGHNVWDSGSGVFVNLNQLKKGDVVVVVDAKGTSVPFVVRDMRTYDAADTHTGIFDSKSGAHLNLITCSGTFDPITKRYTKRLVVFTDAA